MAKVEEINKMILEIEDDPNEDANLISDKYHTFGELYEFRKLYNAALFNAWAQVGLYEVHKSYRHNDGEKCFGSDDWFIVVAVLPGGQISNHYKACDFHLFDIPFVSKALYPFDGHTSSDVLNRLYEISDNEDDI